MATDTAQGAATAPEIANPPFEKALEELELIVKRLERGEALKTHCEALLKRAEARIEKITIGPAGQPTGTAPLDPGN